MNLISESNKVNTQDETLFEKLSKVENFKLIMPQNVSKFEIIDSNSFIFSIKGIPAIKLKIGEKIKPSKIILESIESKINFTLTAFISVFDSETCSFHLEFDGDLNPMIQMMVKTPLQSFINDLSNNINNLI
ncbi:MAG: SRPBCC family protein [Bacteroidetes bacterium]|nr:SRPBCC family protein [Bacteroidota bacterium]MDA0995277.1 SRPBCC family protein [Pseudomonadota bacterium]